MVDPLQAGAQEKGFTRRVEKKCGNSRRIVKFSENSQGARK